MFDNIITYSVQNKFVIGLFTLALIIWGIFSLRQLPVDAVPDITNNQVQILTVSPTLATQEVEQFITAPVELALQNIQNLVEIRSISRFGLSAVTVVFEESMDLYRARQLVSEYLKVAEENIPEGMGSPELAPISTGLGEIYQYVVRPEEGFEDEYSPTELRSIQDWIVKRQLSGIEGVVEVNTLGGYLKQYEVAVDPTLLKSIGISITDVFDALENSNENTGGAYIDKNPRTYYIRSNGIAKSLEDIEQIVVDVRNGRPILIRDLATVQFGKAPRYGALTRDGREVVGGTVMMLKGANSAAVTERIRTRVVQIQKSLPEGVVIEPYLVRDKLVSTAIGTVKTNLIEGGLIVIFILVLMLGNWRAGIIVASVIPLSMLFAVSMMNIFGISANLMSLGAIDFGLIVDGAVIIVESIVHRLQIKFSGKHLTTQKMDGEVISSSQKIRNSAAFGEIIILMVYIPILALVGIEGKMFKPMAQTVMLAIGGALILSLTYIPMMCALFLNKKIINKRTIADRIIEFFQKLYTPILRAALRFKLTFVSATIVLFGFSAYVFTQMGGEFIPTLEEGDLALHQILPPGSSLSQSVEISKIIQKKLLEEFPEVEDVVTKIGSSEIPTDPMPVETGDIIVILKPKSEWTSASTRQELFHKMEESLLEIPGLAYEFSQPIQMRFNELMTGSRADIAIKLYGDDLDILYSKAKEAEKLIQNVNGVGTIKVEQTVGMPQIIVNFKYDKMAQYGLQIKEVNRVIKAAFAGEKAGTIYEGDRRFDLVVRQSEAYRHDIDNVENLFITLKNGTQVPLNAVADVQLVDAPMQISRDNTNRRITIGVNVGNTDVESLVEKIQDKLETSMTLPPGYFFSYGGQFENLKAAQARLMVAVPIALALIFVLLYFTFGSFSQAILIFTAIPLSAIGGVWALEIRGLPFSISAGIGFIALFGVAVLNGIVLIGYFNQLQREGVHNIRERIVKGTQVRLRPVLLTAAVASLGFLPMALSNSGGAEVQRPLATVVIGGLITATFLTLIILPILYSWLAKWRHRRALKKAPVIVAVIMLLCCSIPGITQAQNPISLDDAIEMVLTNHPDMQAARLTVEKNESMQNLKYNPGPTEILYQGDGLFSTNTQLVHQIGVTQLFDSPGKLKAINNLQNEIVVSSEMERQISEKELIWQTKSIYFDIQYKKELAELYQGLIDTYDSYHTIAKKRVEVGAANALESLTLQSKMEEYLLLNRQAALELSNLERRFQLLLSADQTHTTADKLEPYPMETKEESPNIWLQKAQQNIRLEELKVELAKTDMKPDFKLGYAAQNYYEGGWLHGVQAGIQLPLFTNQIKRKIQSQRKQIDISRADYRNRELKFNLREESALNAISLYEEGVAYYQNQRQTINPEIARISKLNYEAGEISYLELLNTLNLMSQQNMNYLDQLLAHNKAIIYYQYLTLQ